MFYTYRLGTRLAQEGLEVPAGQQLDDDVTWVLVEADSDEVDDVRVVELAHDQSFHQEVSLCLVGGQFWQCLQQENRA